MARIKIKDLPKDMKISADEMRRIHAGASYDPTKFVPITRTDMTTRLPSGPLNIFAIHGFPMPVYSS